MVFSGFILRSEPDRWGEMLAALQSVPGLCLGEANQFAVPVAAASANDEEAQRLNEQLADLPGVLSAILVYHRFDYLSESD